MNQLQMHHEKNERLFAHKFLNEIQQMDVLALILNPPYVEYKKRNGPID